LFYMNFEFVKHPSTIVLQSKWLRRTSNHTISWVLDSQIFPLSVCNRKDTVVSIVNHRCLFVKVKNMSLSREHCPSCRRRRR
jgi:hypothetical protein